MALIYVCMHVCCLQQEPAPDPQAGLVLDPLIKQRA